MDSEDNLDQIILLKQKKSSLVKSINVIEKDEFDVDVESKKDEIDEITDNLENNLILQNFGKKKKRKKITFNFDEVENVVPLMPDKNEPSVDNEETRDNVDISLDIDFSMSKKKRKHKKKELVDLLMDKVDDVQNFEDNANEFEQQQLLEKKTLQLHEIHATNSNCEVTDDIDYTYDELLKRAFDIMLEKNPDIANGRRAKFVMRPPQVIRVGTKKTSFANFMDIAKTLHRMPKHLLDFLLAELGTSGSMDGNKQLIIKGRFHAKQIENVLRRYIKEYVTCHTCRSPDTLLQKETRLFFLKCETCGSRCSVASIKSGFQAVTGKRAAIRAKTT